MTRTTPMILLDVGSTNSRAWLVSGGEILASRTAPVGVRDSARERSTALVRATTRDLIAALLPPGARIPVAAAGMITSSLGLADVPPLLAPVSAADLAGGVVQIDAPDISTLPILLVPGVRTAGSGDGVTEDIMRGEETLIVGLLAMGMLAPGSALLNAGSHWKLIRIDERGRIASSRTSLGGEVMHAVQTATLLAASLPDGPLSAVDAEWLHAGSAAAGRDGLLRALFDVRLLDQRGTTTAGQRFSWFAGACISEDLQALLRTAAVHPGMRVTVAGPGAIPQAWTHLLTHAGVDAAALDSPLIERGFITGLMTVANIRQQTSRSAGTGAST